MSGIDDSSILGADLTTFANGLKTRYLPTIRVQFNSSTIALQRLRRNKFPVSGIYVEVAMNTARSEGNSFVRTGAQLPDPHWQTHEKMRFRWQNNYGRIKLDGRTIAASRSDAGAFVSIMDSEIKGMVRDFNNEMNRKVFSDGSGRLGIVSSIASAAAGTLQIREVFDVPDQARKLRWIRKGMIVAIVDASVSSTAAYPAATCDLGVDHRRWAYVSGVDRASKTITLTTVPSGPGAGSAIDLTAGTAPPAIGDAIVRVKRRDEVTSATTTDAYLASTFRGHTDASGTIAEEHEIMGLAGLVSDEDVFGTYNAGVAVTTPLQNISATTNPDWQAYVEDGGGAVKALDTIDMQTVLDEMEETGNGMCSAIFCSYGVQRAYQKLLSSEKRFVNTMTLDGGKRVLTYNDMPFIPEKDCPTGHMFFLDESTIGWGDLEDLDWLAKDGSILSRLDDYDAYQATLVLSTEMALDRRNANGLLKEIQEA